MSLSELSAADVAAVTGNNRGGDYGGFGGFGNNSDWLVVLFLFAMFGGWGGNRGGNYGGGYGGGYDIYPWLNNSNQINDGFQNQMLNTNVVSIRDGIYGLSSQMCNGFAGVTNAFAQAEIANNARQMADMQQMFNLSQQLSQCCCDNRLATCQTQNIVQNEANMTRFADANNTRDIIDSNNRGFQSILDKLCQLELDGLKQDNANLRTQLNMANLAASQTAQTAELRQSGATQLNQLVSELRSCPIPAQPVYGTTPIFNCTGNNGCGCGCGVA